MNKFRLDTAFDLNLLTANDSGVNVSHNRGI